MSDPAEIEDIQLKSDKATHFLKRSMARWHSYADATTALHQHFIDAGDDKSTAKQKVRALANEISANQNEPIMRYIMGVKAPLISGVNNSVLSFMDTAAKTVVTSRL